MELSVVEHLSGLRPDLRIFLDRVELDTGVAWQSKLYDALDSCRKVVSFYSPQYLNWKMCQEEYNIARIREREEGHVLFPIFLLSAALPASRRIINYVDCREADPKRPPCERGARQHPRQQVAGAAGVHGCHRVATVAVCLRIKNHPSRSGDQV
jgi:hypothetical protein